MNRPTHQSGRGLFISVRSPSHTWPVVLSLRGATFLREVTHSSSRQATMPTRVAPEMKRDQKPWSKSLMAGASFLLEGDAGRGVETLAVAAPVGPGADPQEGAEGDERGDDAQGVDVHSV